ncbi:MAG: HNH endonuclease [Lentisphaerae bacterium]|jgi:5-methylcytosine-specific restriction endonuclease McrA|nr:HNH endonuclease [Lentisphaerota bacterium]
MSEWIDIRRDDKHMARERAKARELRQSQWWRQECARGVCHYCGKSFQPDQLTMDHVVPVARGGKSVKGNVVPACQGCNKSKSVLTPAEQILAELTSNGLLADDPQPDQFDN